VNNNSNAWNSTWRNGGWNNNFIGLNIENFNETNASSIDWNSTEWTSSNFSEPSLVISWTMTESELNETESPLEWSFSNWNDSAVDWKQYGLQGAN